MKQSINFEGIVKEFLKFLGVVVIVGMESRIIYMTEKYAELFGISKPYPIGRKLSEYVPTESLSAVIRTGKESIEEFFEYEGKIMVINRLLIRKDDEVLGGAALLH